MSRLFAYLSVLLTPLFAFGQQISSRQTPDDPLSFDWYKLAPSDDIQWTPCFYVQLCARLNLPLDYSKPDGPTTQIALQMIPATDKENYQGTILINPGGPGGAGTLFMFAEGAKLASVFGPTFDILGFDPRGVGATTPLAACFDTANDGNMWQALSPGLLSAKDGTLQLARAQAKLLRELCSEKLGGNGKEEIGANATEWGVGRFMGTPNVVRDMLSITQKLGQEKIRYYGISYGTIVGQYLAAMYPDKIERMIIDGVVDGEGWLTARNYNNVKDVGLVLKEFYKDCVAAGPSKCPIWEKTPFAVERRLENVLDSLRKEPIPVPHTLLAGPLVLTEDLFLNLVFVDLYSPLTGFPDIAELARAVETKNQTRLSQINYLSSDLSDLPPWFQPSQALYAIECSDFPPITDSLDDEIAALNAANKLVPRLGLFGASGVTRIRVYCAEWPVKQKGRYAGPLAGKLPTPVLVTSSRYDLITPLEAARNVTARYEGMRLLVQNSAGHATYSALSNCTASAMRAYMTRGELPEEGAVCEQDTVPFIGRPEPVTASLRLRLPRPFPHLI